MLVFEAYPSGEQVASQLEDDLDALLDCLAALYHSMRDDKSMQQELKDGLHQQMKADIKGFGRLLVKLVEDAE